MGPLKLLRQLEVILLLLFFFFYRKDKAKLCFLQQDFNSNLWKKLEHELNEL